MVTRSSQQQEDTSLAVLDLVVAHVDSLYTLAQLSVVNKRCRSICAAHATHQLQALLLPALRQAALVPAPPLHQQHMDSIKWLCSVAGKEAFRSASAAVLAIPNVPTGAVRMLAEAGVHVSDAAVLAAALKQQLGVEAWLQALEPAVTPLASLAAQLRSPAGTLQESAAAAGALPLQVSLPCWSCSSVWKAVGGYVASCLF
uniref:F-box domain-containing protein n=1 Tax=Tetradesmus obliquus TaxID=3088 RepID=A0A383VBJ6_TETOB